MNREIYPGGLYPLMGDVQSQAGSNTTKVVQLQGIPIEGSAPVAGNYLVYDGTQWISNQPWNDSIEVNGVSVSDDFLISVNVVKEVLVNGA